MPLRSKRAPAKGWYAVPVLLLITAIALPSFFWVRVFSFTKNAGQEFTLGTPSQTATVVIDKPGRYELYVLNGVPIENEKLTIFSDADGNMLPMRTDKNFTFQLQGRSGEMLWILEFPHKGEWTVTNPAIKSYAENGEAPMRSYLLNTTSLPRSL
ncbi:MAG: hypothetical protein LBJ12_04245 [Oscillospiraceae bacterium]|jgi:hypothetical protein|nr:hypothetical protein [Oscillospiraceae bacterium]